MELSKQLIELSKQIEDHLKFKVSGEVKVKIELSEDIILPYHFSAEVLHPGTFKGFTIEEHEIVNAKDTIFISQDNYHNYEINKDHNSSRKPDSSISDLVGRVTSSIYNENKKALIFEGEVYDKEIAIKLAHGLLKYVSLRINPGQIDDEHGQRFARKLMFEELSFVRAPGDPDAHVIVN